MVLIPLLVDDPLWVAEYDQRVYVSLGLNPSFSGWPSLGKIYVSMTWAYKVLIPLLVDDPLWVFLL